MYTWEKGHHIKNNELFNKPQGKRLLSLDSWFARKPPQISAGAGYSKLQAEQEHMVRRSEKAPGYKKSSCVTTHLTDWIK